MPKIPTPAARKQNVLKGVKRLSYSASQKVEVIMYYRQNGEKYSITKAHFGGLPAWKAQFPASASVNNWHTARQSIWRKHLKDGGSAEGFEAMGIEAETDNEDEEGLSTKVTKTLHTPFNAAKLTIAGQARSAVRCSRSPKLVCCEKAIQVDELRFRIKTSSNESSYTSYYYRHLSCIDEIFLNRLKSVGIATASGIGGYETLDEIQKAEADRLFSVAETDFAGSKAGTKYTTKGVQPQPTRRSKQSTVNPAMDAGGAVVNVKKAGGAGGRGEAKEAGPISSAAVSKFLTSGYSSRMKERAAGIPRPPEMDDALKLNGWMC